MEKKKSTQLRNHKKPESKTTRSTKFKPKEEKKDMELNLHSEEMPKGKVVE